MDKLIWEEVFDYDGAPNPERWNTVTGGGGFGNNELQFYTGRPENIRVDGDSLKINLLPEEYENRSYTSARINTAGKFSFTYGRAEISAKLPRGKGTWPAIWLLAENIKEKGWPACGEIDIMEHTGTEQDKIVFSLHSLMHNHTLPQEDHTMKYSYIEGVSDGFHTYGVTRTPESIAFSVDGVEYARFWKKDCKSWPFDTPFFFILNVACGGNFGGTPDPAALPQCMEVKHIRVFDI